MPLCLQAAHNERIKRESKSELINGHILAMPFSDRWGRGGMFCICLWGLCVWKGGSLALLLRSG